MAKKKRIFKNTTYQVGDKLTHPERGVIKVLHIEGDGETARFTINLNGSKVETTQTLISSWFCLGAPIHHD